MEAKRNVTSATSAVKPTPGIITASAKKKKKKLAKKQKAAQGTSDVSSVI
jgi:hypothetical protein